LVEKAGDADYCIAVIFKAIETLQDIFDSPFQQHHDALLCPDVMYYRNITGLSSGSDVTFSFEALD
jgi:hypothetical protein